MLTRTAATDVGLVRPANEDSYACLEGDVFIVADGMGGHAAGEVASFMLVETTREILEEKALAGAVALADLKQAILEANDRILKRAADESECAGMGTTASILYIHENKALLAHVGDSRIYVFRNGQLTQLTKDHSLVWDLVESGSITMAEAREHPQRNLLTRAVGVDHMLEVDTAEFQGQSGDIFLLCSDGLTNMVSDEAIAGILSCKSGRDPSHQLIEQALKGGGTDNITAIVVGIDHA